MYIITVAYDNKCNDEDGDNENNEHLLAFYMVIFVCVSDPVDHTGSQ